MRVKMLFRGCIYFALVFCVSSCSDVVDKFSGSGDESEETAGSSSEDLDALEKKLLAEKERLRKRLRALEDAVEDSEQLLEVESETLGRLNRVRDYAEKVEIAHSSLEKALGEWRTATRSSFNGVKLPEVVTDDGREYTDITITEVTDNHLTFEHSSGNETVEIARLPLGLRKNLIHETTVLAEGKR